MSEPTTPRRPEAECLAVKRGPSWNRLPWQERLMARVAKGPGCWLWTGKTQDDGYGRILVGGGDKRKLLVHRLAWTMAHGEIPDGMQVLHECDVRNCVNPDHLFLGTNADNQEDKGRKGRARGRVLTESDVVEVRRMRLAGRKTADIAKQFGVGGAAIRAACRRRSWRHVSQ